MRKIQYFLLHTLLVGMAAISFSSCSNDDNYQAAEKVAADNLGAYFASSNAAEEIITPEEYASRPSVDLMVKRKNTKGAATVDVIIDKADPEFDIPASVDFKDGDSTAVLTVGYKNLEQKKTYKLSIHLQEDTANPYEKVDGSYKFNYSIMVARWLKVVEQGTFYCADSRLPQVYSDIYQLEGQNKFRIENFLGSGIDLSFYIIPKDASGTWTTSAFSASDRTTWSGIFMPLDHYLNDPDGGSYWWLMTDDESDYMGWTPEGSNVGISYINFYKDTTTDDYGSIDMNGSTSSYAGFLIPYIYFSDDTTSGYTYVYMYWDSTNIPSNE